MCSKVSAFIRTNYIVCQFLNKKRIFKNFILMLLFYVIQEAFVQHSLIKSISHGSPCRAKVKPPFDGSQPRFFFNGPENRFLPVFFLFILLSKEDKGDQGDLFAPLLRSWGGKVGVAIREGREEGDIEGRKNKMIFLL